MPKQRLAIATKTKGAEHLLRLSGELDMASTGLLDTRIAELCADGARSIELDLGELDFMDSTGLRALIVGKELCVVNDCRFSVGPLSAQVQRLFEITGVGERLTRPEPGTPEA
jgi:anti-sigma B factor antagonist